MIFNGLEIITADHLFETSTSTPKRRSKKKRTQKKFNKKYGFIRKINYNSYIIGNKMYCHSRVLDKLTKEINKGTK